GPKGARPQTFPVRRCPFQRPCERGQRAAARPTRDVVLWKDGLQLVPERARLPGAALVRRGLAHEIEPPARACARGVEEVAVACDLIRSRQPGARALVEIAACVVAEERRLVTAARETSLLQPEEEHHLESAGARPQEVEHSDPSGFGGG